MTNDVLKISANDAPEMVSLLLCILLYKLGGQITLTLSEIQAIYSEFPRIRFALTQYGKVDATFCPEKETITVTLQAHDHNENDRLTGGRNG